MNFKYIRGISLTYCEIITSHITSNKSKIYLFKIIFTKKQFYSSNYS